MNKNLYRIVFNKARNMFMAVAENVRSQSKAAGQSTSSEIVSSGQSLVQEKSFHQLWHVKALVVSISLLVPFAPVYAAIVADSAANAANRAVIGAGKNSAGTTVPVVNIQTPKNGISHNIYKQFDVLAEGAVLNNSRTGATTKTVGTVGANPFLATGEARVILNEVNSTAASRFEGNLEVAGQMADVIIANPSGINIKGGGFINANKAIFTTGKPQLNADGSIKQFTVDQGKITVSANPNSKFGLGGNNNDANYVDLYARALELSAELRAKNDIQVIAGANNVSADLQDVAAKTGTGTAPTLAVDVKALGGMYANNIYLMGTEKGLGVTNAGTLQAVNNLVITSAGKIEHSGTISSTSKTQGLVSVQTTGTGAVADINSSGSINSNSMLNIDSGNNLNVNAKEIIINNGSLATSPLIINTKGNLNLAANSRIFNDAQSGELYVDAANINLATNAGITSNRGSAYIQSQKDVIAAQGAKLIAAQDLNVSGKGKLSLTGNQIQASLGSINLQADSSNTDGLIDIQGGTIYGGKDLNLYSSGDINLKSLGFALENAATRVKNINGYSGRNLIWDNTAKTLPQISGKVVLEAENNLALTATGLSSKGSIQLQGAQLSLNSGLTSLNNISLTSGIADLVLNNALNAQNNIDISALTGGINATNLKVNSNAGEISILAKNNINLESTQTIDNSDSDIKITADITTINSKKGIKIGSLGSGKVNLRSVNAKAVDGDIYILSNNGVNLDANVDSYYGSAPDYNLELKEVKNNLISKNVFIENKKSLSNIHNTSLDAEGNIEIHSNDDLSMVGIDLKSQNHTAISSSGNIVNNSLSNIFTSSGLLSLIGKKSLEGGFYFTGGSVLIEVDSIIDMSNIFAKTTSSNLLMKEPILNSLNGDLTIQTNQSLTLNKKKINSAGDLNLISKNGALTIVGFDESPYAKNLSDLSEFYADGNLLFEGASIQLNGAKINTKKDINIISTKNDLRIDGASLWHNEATNFFSAKKDIVNNDPEKESFLSTWVRGGVENFNTQLTSSTGKINIASKKGISITGSDINANQGGVYIQAQGVLDEIYKSTALTSGNASKAIRASIILDGNIDSYGKGGESDANYSYREYVNPTNINGEAGVNIRAMGTSINDNIIFQGVGITSNQGDVNIEANKNILFDVALETLYDRSTKKEIKRSWYGKKKVITTTSIGDIVVPASVDVYGKNINVVSSFKNPMRPDGTRDTNLDTSIDIYSARFNANGGKVSIKSGGNINFLTVSAINNSNVNTVKKSSWLGINLGTSKTNATRNQTTQLPAQLKADYIETKSGYDTRLDGTEFTYLKSANIQAGGVIKLNAIIDRVDETLNKEKTSVVWQSMQDKGSITETAKLPNFNGPVAPTFKAAGGLAVQVPVKDDVRSALDTLVNQQGTTYLKDLVLRNDVDWQAVKLAQQQWDYKSQGLTPAAAAIIVIIITVATYGYGAQGAGAALFQTSSATSSAMANAAVASMASQAAISLANNGGDPLKALKSLGSSEYIKSLAVSVLSAGALSAVGGTAMMQNLEKLKQSGDLVQKIVGNTAQALVNSTIGAGINTAVSGNSLSENLENYLASGAMTALQGTMAQYIKPLESQGFSIEYVLHKIAHAAAGCGAAAATKQSCEAGAIGAGVSEVAAEYLRNPKVFNSVDDALAYKNQIVEVSKGIAGAVAVVTGYDSNTAMASADNALKNNFVFLAAVPTAGEALVGLTLGAIRTCATNAACVSRAAQLGISVSATLAANSNSTDDKKVVKPISVSSGGGTATPPPEDEDKIKEILEKTSPGRATKGRTTQYEKQGDYSTAQKDFNSLQPKDIRTISGPNNQTGWVGKLNDGRIVNVRNWSSNNEITLEIQSGSKVIKIRYSK